MYAQTHTLKFTILYNVKYGEPYYVRAFMWHTFGPEKYKHADITQWTDDGNTGGMTMARRQLNDMTLWRHDIVIYSIYN
jgi:carbohydrate-binding DOMON domain-containing protein